MNIVLALLVIVAIIFAVYYQKALSSCENNQSPFCPKITCPGSNGGLCQGYAQRTDKSGKIYCSFDPVNPISTNS